MLSIPIGMDPHKRSDTVELIDTAGRVLAIGRYGMTRPATRKCALLQNDSPTMLGGRGCDGISYHIGTAWSTIAITA
ncbi:hypothetical protein GFY24_38825 [Nocardia sp. SYP-A9097]|nr:hypothetical protein [Nocardia sp. SYP-A9097]